MRLCWARVLWPSVLSSLLLPFSPINVLRSKLSEPRTFHGNVTSFRTYAGQPCVRRVRWMDCLTGEESLGMPFKDVHFQVKFKNFLKKPLLSNYCFLSGFPGFHWKGSMEVILFALSNARLPGLELPSSTLSSQLEETWERAFLPFAFLPLLHLFSPLLNQK